LFQSLIQARMSGSQAGFILPGTLTERMTRTTCTIPTTSGPARSAGNRHPHPDRRSARRLPPWFDTPRRLRALITELETLSQEIADNDPAGTGTRRPRGHSPLNLWAAARSPQLRPYYYVNKAPLNAKTSW
jgi:hypothetical protein